ncbi:hypothetical protein BGZ95_005974, partial [Linnemannia exigua]
LCSRASWETRMSATGPDLLLRRISKASGRMLQRMLSSLRSSWLLSRPPLKPQAICTLHSTHYGAA